MSPWISVNIGLTLVLFGTTLWFLARRARRERRLTPELALFLATLLLAWMEAVIDWGAFVYYSPDWPHFPTDWPIVRLIPFLPLHIPLVYPWFFFGGAWVSYRMARVLLVRFPRFPRGLAFFGFGFLGGFVLDALIENLYITVPRLWTYTQTWRPLALRAGTDTQWPVYMGLAMALAIGSMAFLLGTRNDRGEDLVAVAVRRLGRLLAPRSSDAPAGASLAVAGAGTPTATTAPDRSVATTPRRRSPNWIASLIGWVIAVHLAYGAVTLPFAVMRWTGVQTTVGTVKPYSDGPAWYDDDVTKPDNPGLTADADDGSDIPPKVG